MLNSITELTPPTVNQGKTCVIPSSEQDLGANQELKEFGVTSEELLDLAVIMRSSGRAQFNARNIRDARKPVTAITAFRSDCGTICSFS